MYFEALLSVYLIFEKNETHVRFNTSKMEPNVLYYTNQKWAKKRNPRCATVWSSIFSGKGDYSNDVKHNSTIQL